MVTYQSLDTRGEFMSDSASVWVYALEHGVVVGAARTKLHSDDDSELTSWWITDLFVAPKYRRRGIGRKLVEHCVKQATLLDPHCAVIGAGIDLDNRDSRSLFEKCGFRLSLRYPDGTALLYSLEVGESD